MHRLPEVLESTEASLQHQIDKRGVPSQSSTSSSTRYRPCSFSPFLPASLFSLVRFRCMDNPLPNTEMLASPLSLCRRGRAYFCSPRIGDFSEAEPVPSGLTCQFPRLDSVWPFRFRLLVSLSALCLSFLYRLCCNSGCGLSLRRRRISARVCRSFSGPL